MTRVEGERAEALLQDVLARFEAVGDDWGVGGCLTDLGLHAFNQGDAETAVAYYERFLAIADAQQNERYRAVVLGNLAQAHYYLGHDELAYDLSVQQLALAEQLASAYSRASALGMLSRLALDRGELAQAAALGGESLGLRWELGDKWNLAPTLETTAAILAAGDRAAAAAGVYAAAQALREAIGSPLTVLEEKPYDRSVATLRAALDEAAFARAWAAGCQRQLVTAVSDATEALRELSSQQSAAITTASSAVNRSTSGSTCAVYRD
jgi:hypothetical protein